MSYKGSTIQRLHNLEQEILNLFKKNGRYYLINDIIKNITTTVTYITLKRRLEKLILENKIKKVKVGERTAYG